MRNGIVRGRSTRTLDVMNATGAKWTAGIVIALLGSFIAAVLLENVWSSRYDGEIIISLPGLALLTFALAIPGGLALIAAVFTAIYFRRVSAWMVAGLLGSALAASGATYLAFAANCVPQCQGAHGSLSVGLMLAFPAGFGVGAFIFTTWLWSSRALITALVARRLT